MLRILAGSRKGFGQYLPPDLPFGAVLCYNTSMRSQKFNRILAGLPLLFAAGSALAQIPPEQNAGTVPLIEPLGGATSIPILPGFGTFLTYFNSSVGWIFQVAVGFTVVWVLIGGFLYMTSGNNQSQRSAAISRMTWAIAGLLILLFAGFLLRTLNDIFFVV